MRLCSRRDFGMTFCQLHMCYWVVIQLHQCLVSGKEQPIGFSRASPRSSVIQCYQERVAQRILWLFLESLLPVLYDQKAKLRADNSNLNKFRVQLATKKEASLAKLPPCEATFHQHVLRASLQTYIWKSSQKAQLLVRSPLMFGWEDKGGLVPVFFR